MRRIIGGAIAFAACTGATGSVRQDDRLEDGLWQMSIELVDVDGPDATPAMRQRLQGMSAAVPPPACLGGPVSDSLAALRAGMTMGMDAVDGSACRYSDDDHVGGGNVRLSAICRSPRQPTELLISLTGRYTPSSIEVDQVSVIRRSTAPDQPYALRIQNRIVMRRTGPCRAG